jgi:hypothetical protein
MTALIPFAEAARAIPTDPTSLRRACNRFGLFQYGDDRQRRVPEGVVALMRRSKQNSGYLYPRHINTLDKLLAAASEISKAR